MKTNKEILGDQLFLNRGWLTADERSIVRKAMDTARIDTLLHLKDQMLVNAKKLTGESCVKLVEQLIEEIKKS